MTAVIIVSRHHRRLQQPNVAWHLLCPPLRLLDLRHFQYHSLQPHRHLLGSGDLASTSVMGWYCLAHWLNVVSASTIAFGNTRVPFLVIARHSNAHRADPRWNYCHQWPCHAWRDEVVCLILARTSSWTSQSFHSRPNPVILSPIIQYKTLSINYIWLLIYLPYLKYWDFQKFCLK